LGMVYWAGYVHAVPNQGTKGLFLAAFGDWLLSAAIIWVLYLALEPEARARWPHAMVTWNRALAGRWLDAQVGAHILIGGAVGSFLWTAFKVLNLFLGMPKDRATTDVSLFFTLGTRHWIGGHAGNLENALWMGLTIFLAIFGLRHWLKRDLLAALAVSVLYTMSESEVTNSADWLLMGAVFVVLYMILIYLLLRLGLVAIISTVFFISGFNDITLGTDCTTWYAPFGLATVFLLLGLAVFGLWRSLGTRDLLGNAEAVS